MPCGISSNLQIELGGKAIIVEVEVIDRPLDYVKKFTQEHKLITKNY